MGICFLTSKRIRTTHYWTMWIISICLACRIRIFYVEHKTKGKHFSRDERIKSGSLLIFLCFSSTHSMCSCVSIFVMVLFSVLSSSIWNSFINFFVLFRLICEYFSIFFWVIFHLLALVKLFCSRVHHLCRFGIGICVAE